ncbi:MAG: hypothetical protein JWP81_4625 [Ferruginibacter sp.]|nr:hypothetical protein [Ferruginibacter sp.]
MLFDRLIIFKYAVDLVYAMSLVIQTINIDFLNASQR